MRRLMVVMLLLGVACGGSTDTPKDPPKDAGVQLPKCSATCAGCCFGDACQTGSTNSACGKGGEACKVCAVNTVCKADQTCGVDPESTWTVQPISATVATTTVGGATWDAFGGAPDPWVQLWCPADAMSSTYTPTASDTFSPTWSTGGCSAKAKELLAKGVGLAVYDEDVTTDDTIASRGAIALPEDVLLSGTGTVGTKGLDGGAGGNLPVLNFTFTKQP